MEKKTAPREYLRKKRRRRIKHTAFFLLILALCSVFAEYAPLKLFRGLPAMVDLLLRILKPDPIYLKRIFFPLLETIEIAVIASFLGTAVSLPLAVLMSRNSGLPSWFTAFFSAIFAVLRTVPALIWAAFLVSMFSVGFFSGIAATFLIATFIATRLLREQIDAIRETKILSIRSTGASGLQILRYCILPETSSFLISVFFTVLESCIRSASILGLVGAGGIGQILWKDLNFFRYDHVATVIFLLFLTIYLIDLLSSKAKNMTGRTLITVTTVRGFRIKRFGLFLSKLIFTVLLITFIILIPEVTGERFQLGLRQGGYILKNLLTPDFSYAYKLYQGISESLAIAVFATIIGGGISYLAVSLSAQNISPSVGISKILKVVTNILRTFPPMITAIIFFRGVGPGPYAGALALSIYTAGVMSKLYTESVEALPHLVVESLRATGASPFQIYRHGIFPESSATFFSLLLYRMESNIRNSTILGMIGAGGIGTALSMNIQWRNWNRVGLLLLGSAAMIILFDMLSRSLRRKMQ